MENIVQQDVNPAVVQPEGVGRPATGASVNPPATGIEPQGVPAAPAVEQPKTEQAIPYDRFKEVNEKAKALEQQNQILIQQMRIQQGQQLATPPVAQKPLFTQVCEKLGYTEDYLTQAQIAHANQVMMEQVQQQTQQQTVIQQYVSSKPDFANVVGKTDPITGVFQIAEPLRRQCEKNPMLAQAILNSPYQGMLAYEIASKDPDYVAYLQNTTQTTAAQQVATALAGSRQMSISAVPGQGTLDKMAVIKNMTPAEFDAYKQKVLSSPG